MTRLRWSALLTGLGALLLALGLLCGLANRHVLDGDRFADHVDAIRTDPAVARQVGDLIVQRVVAANPDLVALRPLLQSTAAALVGSPTFGPVVRAAIRDLHGSLTGNGDGGVVLRLADAVTVLAAVLPLVAPDVATRLPAQARVTLLDAPRGTVGARVARAVRTVGLLSWLLPLLAVGSLAAGWWLSPDRRRGAVRVGYGVVAAGVLVGLVAFVGAVIAGRADEDTLRGALVAATWRELGGLVWTAAAVAVAAGALLAMAASGRLPDLRTLMARARVALTSRPASRGSRIARSAALVAVGLVTVLRPLTALEVLGFVAGLMLVVGGLGELVPPPRPGPEVSPPRRRAFAVPAVAMVVPVALIGSLIAVDAAPADLAVPTVTSTSGPCNGHVELCGRRYDRVAYPATHNAMSAADEPGWFVPEQPTGLVGQLEAGVRVLLIDTYYGQRTERRGLVATAPESYAAALAEARRDFGPDVVDSALRLRNAITGTPSGPIEPYMCHGLCEMGSTGWEPAMAGVKAWLDAHPREVVTFFIEDSVSPADTDSVFAGAGLLPYVYTHVAGTGWPTLGQMINSGHRLVVLMENHGGGAAYPWLLPGFEQVQDTPYSNPTVASLSCALNRGSAGNPLFLVNYWLNNVRSLATDARRINAYDMMWPYVERCRSQRGRLPNYVAVNFYDQGDVFRVVDRLNGFG